MSADITFDDSEDEVEEEDDELEIELEDDVEEEEDNEENDEEENEDEEEENTQSDDTEEKEENEDVDFEDGDTEGIDMSELYDDVSTTKTVKAIFNRKKRVKMQKVSKATKKKKKKMDDIVIQNYMVGDIREKTIKSFLNFKKFDEKECKLLERTIFNSTVRFMEQQWKRKLKKSDLNVEEFRAKYINTVYETSVAISSGTSFKEQVDRLNESMIGLLSFDFRNEKFIDEQETKNIEEPPKAKPGIHRCNKCYYNKALKNDPERGKNTTYYELQTRSQDEPMTQFISCMTCGNNWRQS